MLLRILNYLNFNIHSGQHEILISTFSETSELSTFDLFFFSLIISVIPPVKLQKHQALYYIPF